MPRTIRGRHVKHVGAPLHEDQLGHLQHGPAGVFFHDAPAMLGYGTRTFPFKDEEHRRQLWAEHREQLLAYKFGFTMDEKLGPREPGTRPAAWWNYEAPGPRLPGETQPEALDRMGLLSDDERKAIARARAQRLRSYGAS